MNTSKAFLAICLAFALSISSCKKEKDADPQPVSGNQNGGGDATKDTVAGDSTVKNPTNPKPQEPIVFKYTIKASESTVDGAALKIPAGSYVKIESGTRGPLYIKNFNGEPGRPITFINASGGKTIIKGNSGGPWALKVGYSKHIRFTGTGSSDDYGIVIDGGHNGFTLPELTSDYEIDHVEVKNCGFAGIMGKTDPNCDSKTWRNNFVMKNVSLHDNYIHDLQGEGFYIGNSFYNGKSESCGTVYPHEIHGLRIFNNIVKNTGCEGIQVGCAAVDCEVYDNYIENPGKNPFAAYQNSGLQIGAGTSGKCYNNIVKNAPGNGMVMNGIGGNLVFNNLIVNSGALGIFCDERTEPREGFSFINNTIVNTGSDGIKLYSEQVPYNDIINNIIINPKTGRFINTSSGVKLNEKNNYYSMDIAAAKFANVNAGDFRLANGSPGINKGMDVGSYGIRKDLNQEGRPAGGAYDIGAYER